MRLLPLSVGRPSLLVAPYRAAPLSAARLPDDVASEPYAVFAVLATTAAGWRLGATGAAAERPEASPEATCRPLPAAIPAPTTPAEDAIAGTAAATVIAFMALS